MPWPGVPYALLLLVATVGPPGALSEGNVGCLFSERLCLEDEWCFDDYAFGRCVLSTPDIDEDDLFRYNLERENLHQISRELRRLFALGYRWSHGYTQCRLQAMLYSTKNEEPFEANACSHLVDQDLEGALTALEGQDLMDPHEVAIVKYTPSVENPHADFADEIYYPPMDNSAQQDLRDKILAPNAVDIYDMEDPYAQFEVLKRNAWIPQMHRRSLPTPYFEPPREYPLVEFLNRMVATPEEIQESINQENYEHLVKVLNNYIPEEVEEIPDPYEKFTLTYNTPDNFRAGWESRDTLGAELPEPRIYYEETEHPETEYGSGEEIFRELAERRRGDSAIYTEGGVVYPGEDASKRDELDEFLRNYEMGFKRPERLDVKKPGPPFDALIPDEKRVYHERRPIKDRHIPISSQDNNGPYVVDPDYVYVKFKNEVTSWADGNQIISNISHFLELGTSAFTHGRVGNHEVTFKAVPNRLKLNATQIVQKIDSIREELKEATGIEITSAGIGDFTKTEAIVLAPRNDNEFYIVLFMVCGVLGAMIVAAILLIVIKKHLKTREKLQGLARPDTEASKDYQDLCRARMATKGQPVGDTIGRITSLSRESEQSPSSRSSTSSWSEEPALHNMDISTGHMVLTYMEDHLKNKDRLEQEWVALCAYLAEPCETTIAMKKENVEKNRVGQVVPYDHSRVVLNELSNITGSDYINASSITDHDPRNPAYIATQGPLPNTAADFWQLIWEQGAVVIVMLSRLTEGGAAMCHRYWPEEGSELYHIHEVHLVSEHIWCDDYLVRSFYLKNARTGETRTVTQFHYLSWAEGGVPASTKALLEFRRKVNKSYRGRSCPIVVHCSDGAGRTGTYCLIDMVLSRMAKGAKEIDIAATLEHLRDQRPKMVATKQQFEFVLTAVAEEVHAILKALPPQNDKEK